MDFDVFAFVVLQPRLKSESLDADFKTRHLFGIDMKIHFIPTLFQRGGAGGAPAEPPRRAPRARLI